LARRSRKAGERLKKPISEGWNKKVTLRTGANGKNNDDEERKTGRKKGEVEDNKERQEVRKKGERQGRERKRGGGAQEEGE